MRTTLGVLVVGCSVGVAVAAGATTAVGAPYKVHVGFPDGAAPVNSFVCIGAGCFEAHAVTSVVPAGSAFTARGGDATVDARPGAVIEAGYTNGYRFDPAYGAYWFRGSAGRSLSFTVPRLLTPGAHPELEPAEERFLDLVDQERLAAGLGPLEVEPHLVAASASHADWMLRTNTQSHVGEWGSTPATRLQEFGTLAFGGGEVAYLQGGTPEATIHGFLDSPVHRAILLDPAVRFIGVGNEGDAWAAVLTVTVSAGPTGADAPTALGTPASPVTAAGSDRTPARQPAPAGGRRTVARPALVRPGLTATNGMTRLPPGRLLVFRVTARVRVSARLDGRLLRTRGIRRIRVRLPERAATGRHTLSLTARRPGRRSSTLRIRIRDGRLS